MVKILIVKGLFRSIKKRFSSSEVGQILDLFESLRHSPRKGKTVGVMNSIVVKELKYKKYRFYFITDGFKIKFLRVTDLKSLVIKFVRMSDKKNQKKVISEIKDVLSKLEKDY